MFLRKANKQENEQVKREPDPIKIELDESDCQKQIGFIDLHASDLEYIHLLYPLVNEHIAPITEAFYEKLLEQPHLRQLVTTHSSIDALKQTLKQHILEMFEGKVDAAFFAKRKRIAQTHVRIGLKTKWYIGAFHNLQLELQRMIVKHFKSGNEQFLAFCAVGKFINFEQQLVLEAYEEEERRIRLKFEKHKDTYIGQVRHALQNIEHLVGKIEQSVQKAAVQSQSIETLTDEGKFHSARSLDASKSGQLQVDRQSGHMDHIQACIKQIEASMNELTTLSTQFEEVVAIVKQIADQTTLLSLNASIEAAQAGDYGRGFAVVADQVRKLAIKTKDSSGHVASLVSDVHAQRKLVEHSISEVVQAVEQGISSMETMETCFEQILHFGQTNEAHFGEIQSNVSQLHVSIAEQMKAVVSSAAAAIEQLAAQTANYEQSIEKKTEDEITTLSGHS
ncbi:globin-coupled sensor protein [Shouchella clausii]|uniref:Globin-coupled sensor protein n=1 Tax=Shouchella rhizosphaerae TaxID=866786 RepID=A0ABZ2D0W3_9BACI|nr:MULTISPECIES: globin-coupled sensor protein [Shouchella]MCM3310822.1 protoglobin domain-containing protein [Psychrobacillus sp. MER TA 17]MBU3229810.1 globin-coupled sensor protein [Shouchella clausii]MBU3264106.1 globin-coupled sensor protein [Shouchella clausii]MBU3506711.1 globin-coupled sensor protein [Shouchella clausii]MBU3534022.1 globin-coupled sensor protein [Shouchella clausii]